MKEIEYFPGLWKLSMTIGIHKPVDDDDDDDVEMESKTKPQMETPGTSSFPLFKRCQEYLEAATPLKNGTTIRMVIYGKHGKSPIMSFIKNTESNDLETQQEINYEVFLEK